MTISKEVLDELPGGVERSEGLLGARGLMKELKVRLMERMLGAELIQRLGYKPHGEPTSRQANRRNRTTRKVLKDMTARCRLIFHATETATLNRG